MRKLLGLLAFVGTYHAMGVAVVHDKGEWETTWQNCIAKEITNTLSNTPFKNLRVTKVTYSFFQNRVQTTKSGQYAFNLESSDKKTFTGTLNADLIRSLPRFDSGPRKTIFDVNYCSLDNYISKEYEAFSLQDEAGETKFSLNGILEPESRDYQIPL